MNEKADVVRIRKRVLTYLGSQEIERTQCEIYKGVRGRRDVIAMALSTLCQENLISCSGDGVRCDPRRYIMSPRSQQTRTKFQDVLHANHQSETIGSNMEILI